MKTNALVSLAMIFIASLLTPSLLAQNDVPMVEDNVINVRYRKPPQPSKYYSGTNIRKDKKVKYQTRMIYGWECPSYLQYSSKPMNKREKMLRKQRNKNTYAKLN